MFEMPNDKDISKELVVDQLIKKTNECNCFMWSKRDRNAYFEYFFSEKLNDTMTINFRIYHYKNHDEHTMSIYLGRNRGSRFIWIFNVEEPCLQSLVDTIEKTKTFYREEAL